ncbi:hypothetical protein D022_1928A, partial [Vibrio parahaemolyticus 12310]
MLHHVLNLHFV